MKYENTVEFPHNVNRAVKRKAVKNKLKLKKKLGIAKDEPALDSDLGLDNRELGHDSEVMNAYLRANNVIQ